MGGEGTRRLTAPWRCPTCGGRLELAEGARAWVCSRRHTFDVAREGYVNLLSAQRRRSREPGDPREMIAARRRFLASGAYDPLTSAVATAVAEKRPAVALDVGCGEGRHTRHLRAPLVLGIDVSKAAVAAAAKTHPLGWYAVASAAELPLGDASADIALNVFGPVIDGELARVVRQGGYAVVAHPGPGHLSEVRGLVYADARPHQVKPPLRNARDTFAEIDRTRLVFPVGITDLQQLEDLFAMTPYRWHADQGIHERIAEAFSQGFSTSADILVTTYRRGDR